MTAANPHIPLIAPKPIAEFDSDEYHAYITEMYALPAPKRGAKPPGPAPGLTVSRTKKGALSVRRTKVRPFAYVTLSEIAGLAKLQECSQADLWNMFKRKKFIIAKDRLEAEHLLIKLNEISKEAKVDSKNRKWDGGTVKEPKFRESEVKPPVGQKIDAGDLHFTEADDTDEKDEKSLLSKKIGKAGE